jgi:hypothetical protein
VAALFLPDSRFESPELLIPRKLPRGANFEIDPRHKKYLHAYYLLNRVKSHDLVGRDASAGSLLLTGQSFKRGYLYLPNTQSPTGSPVDFAAADGVSGLWHDSFGFQAYNIRCTLDADSGGPLVLLDIGGSTNGASIIYRTGPNTVAFGTASSASYTEIQSSTTFLPGPKVLDIWGIFDSGALELWVNGKLENSTTVGYSTISGHADLPGLGAVENTYAANDSNQDEWGGAIYSLGVYKHVRRASIPALYRDPYRFLIPKMN